MQRDAQAILKLLVNVLLELFPNYLPGLVMKHALDYVVV